MREQVRLYGKTVELEALTWRDMAMMQAFAPRTPLGEISFLNIGKLHEESIKRLAANMGIRLLIIDVEGFQRPRRSP